MNKLAEIENEIEENAEEKRRRRMIEKRLMNFINEINKFIYDSSAIRENAQTRVQDYNSPIKSKSDR